jgi:hypothetical protein
MSILYVAHDANGDWQFLCGGVDHQQADARVVCSSCMFERYADIGEIETLPLGCIAERIGAADQWTVSHQDNSQVCEG